MFTSRRLDCCLLLAVCLSGTARAGEFVLITQERKIPPGQTATFEFGTVPQRDTTVLLRVTARLHLIGPAGSMYFLNLELNGREIQPARSRRVIRLVNQPLEAPVAANLPAPWFGNHAWRLLYSPSFDYRPAYCPEDPYTYLLDVTDLVNPAAENRLAITNTAHKLRKHWTAPEGDLVLRDLAVTVRPGASPTMSAETSTAPGAWTFFSPDAILGQPREQVREQFRRQGIRFACSWGGWVDPKRDRKRIGFGTGVVDEYWAGYRARLRRAADAIREACPEVKVLMSSRTDFGNVLRALEMACLPVGTRADYPHEISRFLFPFTPIELHAGYLLGRER